MNEPTKAVGANENNLAAATITRVAPAQAEVEAIIQAARKEGSITNADLAEKLAVLELNVDETDAVYQRLVEYGVDVVEDEAVIEEEPVVEEVEQPAAAPEEDRVRARKEVDAALKAPTNDPVRMYLKEIGRVALLTAQEEVSLAKRIEAGVLASEELDNDGSSLERAKRAELRRTQRDGARAKRHLV